MSPATAGRNKVPPIIRRIVNNQKRINKTVLTTQLTIAEMITTRLIIVLMMTATIFNRVTSTVNNFAATLKTQ
jgi:hypothetical protein